jgi:hypothetical protein
MWTGRVGQEAAKAAVASCVPGFLGVFWAVAPMDIAKDAIKRVAFLKAFMRFSIF